MHSGTEGKEKHWTFTQNSQPLESPGTVLLTPYIRHDLFVLFQTLKQQRLTTLTPVL